MRPRLLTPPAAIVAAVFWAMGSAGLLPAVLAAASPAAASTVGGPLLAGRGLVLDLPAGVPAPPRVEGAAYVVADAATGEVLAAKAPHRPLRPASTLKTLLAVTIFDDLDPGAPYTARREDANVEGSRVGMVPGATYRLRNLWEGLFLRSGNDAANGLANAHGGVAATVAEMNATARDLQAGQTRAVNPSGLDEPGQYSSAYDLALVGRAALRSPGIMAYAGMVKSRFPAAMPTPGKARASFEIYTQQKYVLNYDGALGIKNGFTTGGRYTLIAAARRDGRTVIVTIMRSPKNAWRDAAALSDWAFANADRVRPVGLLVEPLSGQAGDPAAADHLPPARAGLTPTGAVADDSGGERLLLDLLTGAVLVVAALRARVIVRRRQRRRSRQRAKRSMPAGSRPAGAVRPARRA